MNKNSFASYSRRCVHYSPSYREETTRSLNSSTTKTSLIHVPKTQFSIWTVKQNWDDSCLRAIMRDFSKLNEWAWQSDVDGHAHVACTCSCPLHCSCKEMIRSGELPWRIFLLASFTQGSSVCRTISSWNRSIRMEHTAISPQSSNPFSSHNFAASLGPSCW